MKNIQKNLKLLIKKENISENELSKRVGIPQQVVNRIISGINLNPKLTTILPIADYFHIPLHELIYEDLTQSQRGFKEKKDVKIPFIKIDELQHGLNHALSKATCFISIDMEINKNYFAMEMYDESMEPKFSFGTILIFEKDRLPCTGDYCLINSEDNQYMFRQVMIDTKDKKYIKCLNPASLDYTLIPLPINLYVLATLLESRTKYTNR